ncbi:MULTISPECIES: hypothetical protein [unclassified Oleiphilus]|uniref:hypothetical protein n=1 Tax=unclassified Oleiphilus TaxID=2631174 RepID=UPI0007C2777E|nr:MULTISPECIES: hypothetical protein [unclassified Oleiphilus]KZY44060.1 hypothetical protein A3732_13080 [Oleiphilus sp. HI0050]KZZ38113.1 hypothetical protein A3757_08745 [Oleiphilus sp. HI0117]KZZ38739.1 hypothetical protein A3756_09610 [Oleiphilus sp. HI0086]KZZ53650.1 hypothetical protein A3761_02345 [Oleiphilus sp. HI0123]
MSQVFFLGTHLVKTRVLHFVITLFCLPGFAAANSLDDEWKAFQQAEQAAFNTYLSEHDRQFVDFLDQHWEEFDLFQGKVRDTTPKPAKAPSVKNLLSSTGKTEHIDTPAYSPSLPLDNEALFFGHERADVNASNIDFPDLSKLTNKKLAATWKVLAQADHKGLLAHVRESKQILGLGDWGTYLYLNFVLEKQISNDNERTSYLWFILTKLGYDVKVAYGKRDLFLMLPSKQTIFGKAYLQISDKTYYLVHSTKNKGPLFSYPGHYDRSNRSFEINFEQVLNSSPKILSRKISFEDSNTSTELSFEYDAGYGLMLNAYPQIDLKYYFTAKPNPTMVESLRRQLKPRLQSLSERDAIDYLLAMIQTGFSYALDQEQFGEENYLLAEESLLYKANDCEDRSILLAWLIQDLLKLDVVGLDFPGHIAVAVATEARDGDWLISQAGKTYVIADPTYIGATTGMVMSEYKSTIPKVIEF